MNKQIPSMQPDTTSSTSMIATMGGIGLTAGILIVLTFQLTFQTIKENKARALERAIFDVVPGAETNVTFALSDDVLQPLQEENETAVKYYACYDRNRRLVGVAMEAWGQGFQDVVRVLYGYSIQDRAIVGLKVLESKETPGLGDKIDTDPDFRANFEALEVSLSSEGGGIVHPVVMVKHGQKTTPWEIEAITGATISSRAVTRMLRESTAVTVPIVTRNLSALKKGIP